MFRYGLALVVSLWCVKPDTGAVKDTVPAVAPAKGLKDFLQRMSRLESDNNPRAVNRFGFLGKYQFHPRTLREIGIKTTRSSFLSNETLQDSAMVRYMKANWMELHDLIDRWSGKTVQGIPVTESGIIAGAHFSGTVGVRAFFDPKKYHKKLSDANGATVAMYMRMFSNYSLGF